MAKFNKIALTAASALAFVFTLSCSDDSDKGDYLTCKQADKVIKDCDEEDEDMWTECIEKKGLCGGGKLDQACMQHYDDECYDEYDGEK